MTSYEIARRGLEPLLPPIYKYVRKKILREVHTNEGTLSILDVGGRKSPYTIGIPARITIIDLPRESEIQNKLGLGISEEILNQVKSRRSNIDDLIIGDMTNSELESESFDMVVSVEVLEHVEEDAKFIREVHRVLKPGGKFIMTTPNGDFVTNHNPDHERHYKREQLRELLKSEFESVEVNYAIAGGVFRKLGLKSWSVSHPVQTVSSAVGNVVNSIQSSRRDIGNRVIGTHHLFATAQKQSR